jgi:hypothetical protein
MLTVRLEPVEGSVSKETVGILRIDLLKADPFMVRLAHHERNEDIRRLLKEGTNVVVLDPDVAKAFRSSAAVNEALRSLLRMSEATRRLTSRSSGRATSARQ